MAATSSIHNQDSKLRVPAGSVNRPISKILYRLAAPFRWYQRTIAHILVLEIRSLVPRIRESRQDKWWSAGSVPVFPDPRPGYHPAVAIARACSRDMEQLQLEYGGNFPLGLRLYARGFSRGASWMLRSCTERSPEVQESSSEESIKGGTGPDCGSHAGSHTHRRSDLGRHENRSDRR